MAAIAATLARYSEAIITDVTHPVGGLPSRLTWLPTVKEVFDACEAEAQRMAAHAARERRIQEQLTARAEEDRHDEVRPTPEQMKAKYGENWGLSDPPRAPSAPAPTWGAIASAYAAEPSRIAGLMHIANERRRLATPMPRYEHEEAAE